MVYNLKMVYNMVYTLYMVYDLKTVYIMVYTLYIVYNLNPIHGIKSINGIWHGFLTSEQF
jgi:hypothetical protein